jgi:hypothetical protein
MFFDGVDVLVASCFDLALIVVLDARGTKGDATQEDGFRTIHQEEGGVTRGSALLAVQAPVHLRQFLEPLVAVLLDRVIDSRLESLKDHTFGTFDLTIASWVSH